IVMRNWSMRRQRRAHRCRYTSAFVFSRERSLDTFKGALIVGFLRLFALLPWSMVQRMGALIGWLMWKLANSSREDAGTNLSPRLPELRGDPVDQLLRDSLRQSAQPSTERGCAWIWPADKTLRLIKEVEGLEVLEQALASGKGVVGITSHLGN